MRFKMSQELVTIHATGGDYDDHYGGEAVSLDEVRVIEAERDAVLRRMTIVEAEYDELAAHLANVGRAQDAEAQVAMMESELDFCYRTICHRCDLQDQFTPAARDGDRGWFHRYSDPEDPQGPMFCDANAERERRYQRNGEK